VSNSTADGLYRLQTPLRGVPEPLLKNRRYDAIDTKSYGELSDSDFEYTWSWFPHLREFFQKAAAANRAMLFTADQYGARPNQRLKLTGALKQWFGEGGVGDGVVARNDGDGLGCRVWRWSV